MELAEGEESEIGLGLQTELRGGGQAKRLLEAKGTLEADFKSSAVHKPGV